MGKHTVKRTCRDSLFYHIDFLFSIMERWNGRGTVRGSMGSLGNSAGQMYQYEILVGKKDLDQARYILRQ